MKKQLSLWLIIITLCTAHMNVVIATKTETTKTLAVLETLQKDERGWVDPEGLKKIHDAATQDQNDFKKEVTKLRRQVNVGNVPIIVVKKNKRPSRLNTWVTYGAVFLAGGLTTLALMNPQKQKISRF